MTDFSPDQVRFGDRVGYGTWDDGHAREHRAFVDAFAAQTPAVLLPNYDFLSFFNAGGARRDILLSHAQVHVMLRPLCGITGVDLSAVDLDNEQQFYQWLGRHATEHQQIREFLGLT